MKSYATALVLLATGMATAASPYMSVKVTQPWSSDIRSAYRILPEAGFGVRFRRSPELALDVGVSSSYSGWGTDPWTSLWEACGRFGAELTLDRDLGIYLTPGVMYVYAQEVWPSHDEEHHILNRTYGGSSIGFFVMAGMMLFRTDRLRLGIETGMDLISVPTDRMYYWSEYSAPDRYWIPLSGFDLGLVFGFDSDRSE